MSDAPLGMLPPSAVKRFVLIAMAAMTMASSARAVEVDPSGVGDVLLFPFYTVDDPGSGGFVTLLSLTNASDHVKAARVRFRDGRRGRSVLEFNLYLRPKDSWVAAILPDAVGASLMTPDRSCTYPAISQDENQPTPLGNDPFSGAELLPRDQARAGYVEVFELGDYGPGIGAPAGSVAAAVMLASGSSYDSTPVDCMRTATDDGREASRTRGSLTGTVTQISVLAGIELTQAPTALANFDTKGPSFSRPETGLPTLADVDPAVSVIHDPVVGTVRTAWTNPVDAVTAILMRSGVSGDVVLDGATASQTSWVLTMPTRPHHITFGQPARAPFTAPANASTACEVVPNEALGHLIDRDGRKPSLGGFPVPYPDRALCWVSTVVNFAPLTGYRPERLLLARPSFASAASRANPYPPIATEVAARWENGWMRIPLHVDASVPGASPLMAREMVGGPTTIFGPDGTVESRPQFTMRGLPVIGFFATTYLNGTLIDATGRSVLSNYSSSVPLRYEMSIQ